jgi:hypothetical protein
VVALNGCRRSETVVAWQARVFGTHIRSVDPKAKDITVTCWGKKMKFGELMAE